MVPTRLSEKFTANKLRRYRQRINDTLYSVTNKQHGGGTEQCLDAVNSLCFSLQKLMLHITQPTSTHTLLSSTTDVINVQMKTLKTWQQINYVYKRLTKSLPRLTIIPTIIFAQ